MYELIYYELKQKNFRSKKTLDRFLRTLTEDQKLRVLKKEKGIYYALVRTPEGFID